MTGELFKELLYTIFIAPFVMAWLKVTMWWYRAEIRHAEADLKVYKALNPVDRDLGDKELAMTMLWAIKLHWVEDPIIRMRMIGVLLAIGMVSFLVWYVLY
jgi:hypothetical protein